MDARRELFEVFDGQAGVWHQPPLLFPVEYLLLVVVSAMDIVLTAVILSLGGWEVNPVAQIILLSSGYQGLIGFKFSIVVLVVVMCETVARRHWLKGHRLALVTIGISAIPVFWSFVQLWSYFS